MRTTREYRTQVEYFIPAVLEVANKRLSKNENTTWEEFVETTASCAVDLAEAIVDELDKRWPNH